MDRAVVWSVGSGGQNQAGKLPATKSDSRFSPDTAFEIKAVRQLSPEQKP